MFRADGLIVLAYAPLHAFVRSGHFLMSLNDRSEVREIFGAFDICHEAVRFWRNRFGQMFAAETLWRPLGNVHYSPESGDL